MQAIAERTATPSQSAQQPKLLDRMVAAIRVKHYSLATERTYVHWIKRFIFFHGKRHPADMGAAEVEAFLSALATELKVSSPGQVGGRGGAAVRASRAGGTIQRRSARPFRGARRVRCRRRPAGS